MVDSAPIVTLRRVFGVLVVFSSVRFMLYGWVDCQIVDPFLTFPFVDWLPRPNRAFAYLTFFTMIVSGITIIRGSRVGAFVFFLAFTYIELLDKSNYLNHYYFVSIIALMLAVLPGNDASKKVPRYVLFTLRFLFALVYFYAGVAKLNYDWIFEAQPLSIWLPQHSSLPIIGQLFTYRETAYAFSWAGALFDLSAPFFMFSNKWRKYFYPILISFHVITWMLFPIGVFPWVMLTCTTVFFPEQTHRKLWSKVGAPLKKLTDEAQNSWGVLKPAIYTFLVFQIVFPMRFLAYSGNLFWHETCYRFGWRVMLIEKSGWARFYVENQTGQREEVDLKKYLTPNQQKMLSTQPDLILQFADFIADQYEEEVGVYAEVYVSLNGRRSRIFIDPNRELSTIEDTWAPRDYVMPF